LLQQTDQLKRDIEVSTSQYILLHTSSIAIRIIPILTKLLQAAALTPAATLAAITQGLQRGAAVPVSVLTTYTALASEVRALDVHDSPALHSCMQQRLQALAALLQQQLYSALSVHAKTLASSSSGSSSSSGGDAAVTLTEPQLSVLKSTFRQLIALQVQQSGAAAITTVWALGELFTTVHTQQACLTRCYLCVYASASACNQS
jgi:hypothetical protein